MVLVEILRCRKVRSNTRGSELINELGMSTHKTSDEVNETSEAKMHRSRKLDV